MTAELIGEIRSHFESRPDSTVVFLLLPADFQVDTRKQELYELSEAEYDLRKPNRIVKAQLEQHGIPCLDLTDALAERYLADPDDRHYFELDRHLNAKGHRLVADEFLEFARTHDLVP